MIYDEYGLDYEGIPLETIHEDDGEFINNDYRNVTNLITMDYINQHDIKGNKIFDSDVLFLKNNLGILLGIVEWFSDEYSTGYRVNWLIGKCSSPMRMSEFEVVGNIYQHPEIIGNYVNR